MSLSTLGPINNPRKEYNFNIIPSYSDISDTNYLLNKYDTPGNISTGSPESIYDNLYKIDLEKLKEPKISDNWTKLSVKEPKITKTPDTTFGLTGEQWGVAGLAGKLALGGLEAYTGFKNMKLAEESFAFNKDMLNKQYAMAEDAYKKNVNRAASIGAQMRGETLNA
jgi:hypothetical protein